MSKVHDYRKGDLVFWKEFMGRVEAVTPTALYVLFFSDDNKTVTGGHWHKPAELRLVGKHEEVTHADTP
jgi:hypothetical protein